MGIGIQIYSPLGSFRKSSEPNVRNNLASSEKCKKLNRGNFSRFFLVTLEVFYSPLCWLVLLSEITLPIEISSSFLQKRVYVILPDIFFDQTWFYFLSSGLTIVVTIWKKLTPSLLKVVCSSSHFGTVFDLINFCCVPVIV